MVCQLSLLSANAGGQIFRFLCFSVGTNLPFLRLLCRTCVLGKSDFLARKIPDPLEDITFAGDEGPEPDDPVEYSEMRPMSQRTIEREEFEREREVPSDERLSPESNRPARVHHEGRQTNDKMQLPQAPASSVR